MKKIVIVMMALYLTGCGGYHYSEGERTGYIVKFSKKGFIWKTWEGEMNVGGMTGGQGTMETEKFHFSVKNQEAVEPVKMALKSGSKVIVDYDQDLYFWNTKGETNHFVNKVH